MLSRIALRTAGRIDSRVQAYVASQCESLLEQLLRDAVTSWENEGFLRWGDAEIDCTVRVYDWCDRLIKGNPHSWPSMRITYDGTLPSLEMRQGIVSAKSARRPDLHLAVGGVTIHIEAKRLNTSVTLAGKYVLEGMHRFTSEAYAWEADTRGAMVSYNLRDAPADGMVAVNNAIVAELTFGATHQAHLIRHPHTRIELYESDHGLRYRLRHFAIDLR